MNFILGPISSKQTLEFFLRIFIACLCGAIIGFERSKRMKDAGVRTHIIVACSAALLMIVSKYSFEDVQSKEPSRIAAQVVSGISFLCAGVIFRNGAGVKGLATAAGLWATAAIGMTIGGGLYLLGIFVTISIIFVQILLHHKDSLTTTNITIVVRDSKDFHKHLITFIEAVSDSVDSKEMIYKENGDVIYSFILHTKKPISYTQWQNFIHENPDIIYLKHKSSET